jgi:hypothetical protein
MINLYRWLAGLPSVTDDATRNHAAQACSLIMEANHDLSHAPPTSWTCYNSEGATAAGKSNISTTPAVQAIELYLADPGNEGTLGHRRWILSNGLGPVGIGSTTDYSCLWVIDGTASGGNVWTAFPPPGEVPIELFTASGYTSVDVTGWSIQSDTINLANAQVTITDGGTNRAVNVSVLPAYYGSLYAIRMAPQGWTSQVGHTYAVDVTGISQAIHYEVQVVTCP